MLISEIKNQNDLEKCLNDCYKELHELCHLDGVFHDSALYGFLTSALTAVGMAEMHVSEFKNYHHDEVRG